MDNFKAAADRLVEQGARAVARRILMERKIAFKIVDMALADGHTVSVFDCEEWTVKRSKVKADIRAALFTTDDDQLVVRDEAGNKLAWFHLIYGNDGYDVLSDFSDTEYGRSVWKRLEPIVDAMELAV